MSKTKPAAAAWPTANASSATQALVLQGGGALGAYQAGVYEAACAHFNSLDWIAGVSIGAINAALIAGNAPAQRIAKLREFWQQVSSGAGQSLPDLGGGQSAAGQWSAMSGMLFGIPGFFTPRMSPALLMGSAAPVLSYYDTAPLKATLERLVDFDRINAAKKDIRLSVGAVNVKTGNSVYFDNTQHAITAEHIMASGALPPGFPPIHIEGEDYWDGGIVSNTPLQYVLDEHPRSERLVVLQVDLFSAKGPTPHTLGDVAQRQKDITYSSRTRMNTDAASANVNLQQALSDLMGKLPPKLRDDPSVKALRAHMQCEPIDIVHLIYRNQQHELESKDYEFSRSAVGVHWQAGVQDMNATLEHPEWLENATHNGITTFDLSQPEHPRVRRPGLIKLAK